MKLDNLESEIQSLDSSKLNLEKALESKSSLLENASQKYSELESTLYNLKLSTSSEISSLTDKLNAQVELVARVSIDLDKEKEAHAHSLKSISELQTSLAAERSLLEMEKARNADLSFQLESEQEQTKLMERNYENALNAFDVAEKTVASIRAQHDELFAKYTNLQSSFDETDDNLRKIRDENIEIINELNHTKSSLETKSLELNMEIDLHAETKSLLDKTSSLLDAEKSNGKVLSLRIVETENSLKSMDSALDSTKSSLNEMSVSLEKEKKEHAALRVNYGNQVELFKSERQAHDETRNELSFLRRSLGEEKSAHENTKSEINELKISHNLETAALKSDYTAKAQALASELQEAQSKYKALKDSSLEQKKSFQAHSASFKNKISELAENLKTPNEVSVMKEDRIASLGSELSEKSAELEGLRNELGSLKVRHTESLIGLERDRDALKHKSHELQSQVEKLSRVLSEKESEIKKIVSDSQATKLRNANEVGRRDEEINFFFLQVCSKLF